MRLLGIDYGAKRVGIALGDTDSRIASAWCVLQNEGRAGLLQKIRELIASESIDQLVVGLPRPLHDQEEDNAQRREIEQFISDLMSFGLLVERIDETLSSRLAATQMHERGEKGKRDDLAAAIILQSWLDKKMVS